MLAPFPLETNRFFSGWELSEVKKGSLTGEWVGIAVEVSRSSSGPDSFRILRRDRCGGLYRAIGVFTISGSKTNWRFRDGKEDFKLLRPCCKKFSKRFCEKNNSQIFSQQKNFYRNSGIRKKFKKIRAPPIFKKCYTKTYTIMTGRRFFPADSKTSRVSTGRLVSSTLQTTSSAMVEYPCRETKRVIVFDNLNSATN